MRNYRKCIHEDHGQLELVLIDPIRKCDAQTGWYCEQCHRVDYEVGGQRSVRLNFHAEALPRALCPKCYSPYLDSTESTSGHCRCIECCVEIKIELVPKADPGLTQPARGMLTPVEAGFKVTKHEHACARRGRCQ